MSSIRQLVFTPHLWQTVQATIFAKIHHEGFAFVALESNHANRPYGHDAGRRRGTLKNARGHAGADEVDPKPGDRQT